MFIVLNEHKVFFLTLSLYMPLFPYEQPYELSSDCSDQLTDQHSELTF